jgi:hypothetical protein
MKENTCKLKQVSPQMPKDVPSVALAKVAPTAKTVLEVLASAGPVANYATGYGLSKVWPMLEGM